MSNPLVSVCMIVKNEEDVLERCLDSITGLWDELIIVDTGSSDRTIEIAESYGATVLPYEWIAPGNKGEARNVGIDAAVGEWIMVIDADEVLCEPERIRAQLQQLEQAQMVTVLFNNYTNGELTLSWRQVRIFRRGACRYQYREHEVPIAQNDTPPYISDFVFEHRVPPGRQTTKSAPMMERLALDVAEHPGEPHPLYFYHRECLNQGHNEKCIELGKHYLALTAGKEFIQSDIHGNMAIAYHRLQNVNKARESLHMAAACEPYNREWFYRLGVLHADCQEWNLSLAMLRAAAEIVPVEHTQWEPQTTTRIYQLIERCQHEMAHNMAHSH